MQEMVELSKTQSSDNIPQCVSFVHNNKTTLLNAGPANFGRILRASEKVNKHTHVDFIFYRTIYAIYKYYFVRVLG